MTSNTPALTRSSSLRLLVCGAVLTLLTGCGGSSSGTVSCGLCGGTPTVITVTFAGSAPTAVATQIGTGSFAPASLSSGKLTVSVPVGTANYAVAYLCPSYTAFNPPVSYQSIVVWEGSTQDGSSLSNTCGSAAGPVTGNLAVSVDASAVPNASAMIFAVYNASTGDTYNLYSNVESTTIPAPTGTDRVEILIPDSNFQIVAAKSLPNQIVPGALNGGNPVILTSADQVTYEPITLSGLPAGFSQPSSNASVVLNGSGPEFVALTSGMTLSWGNLSQYAALPSTALEQGDIYKVFSSATSQTDSAQSVRVLQTLSAAAPVNFSFPAPMVGTAPTPEALPTLSVAYAGFSGSSVYKSAGIQWAPNASNNYNIYVISSASHQNGSSTITIPDLSSVAGFPPAPNSGTSINWTVAAFQSPIFPLAPSPANITLSEVGDGGTYIVP